jgi:hypothetical protein
VKRSLRPQATNHLIFEQIAHSTSRVRGRLGGHAEQFVNLSLETVRLGLLFGGKLLAAQRLKFGERVLQLSLTDEALRRVQKFLRFGARGSGDFLGPFGNVILNLVTRFLQRVSRFL